MKEYLEIGEFVTTHGILGELKLYLWCDGPAFVQGLHRIFFSATGAKETKLEAVRPHKGMCLVKLVGIETVEAARVYINRTVYCARADVKLEENRCFVQDLLGCTVQDADTKETYGVLETVTHPANIDIYTVKNEAGEVFLFPAVPEFLGEVLPEQGLITVRPIAGMFGKGEVNGDAD